MKIVVTGGTGQIGSRLVDDLISDGHEVIVLTRSPEKRRRESNPKASLVAWDGKSAAGWSEHLDDTDVVINFAGRNLAGSSFIPQRWSASIKQEILNSRVEAGKAVVEAIKQVKKKPKLLIQASASGYYGTNLDQAEKPESAQPGDDWLAKVCLEWEAATDEAETLGVRRIIVRTGLILDASEGVLPRFVLPFKLFAGGKFGSGDQLYPWIHIHDEIRALRFLMEQKNANGPYNLCAPNPVSNKDFAKILANVLKRPAWFPVPAFLMKLGLGEVATLVLGGQRMVPEKLQQAGFDFEYPTLEAALRDLLG